MFILLGCISLGTGFEGSEQYFKWRKSQQEIFNSFLGKSPEEIKLIFGEPRNKYGPQEPVPRVPQGADFIWTYGPLPMTKSEGKVHWFYFKDDKLILADV
ncbi:MAG: hypothetical protein COV74_03520 [Candidatus Omnitrophica bacterium CG11_big_fil_rev_8_21_14_0_20_45_26]|uniref:Uncharacterized protein n=1 Tax=Candidatus Abzuiibacterium crystallinum TaxID=1974748 RepID=A0A2H0LQP4_9BACT|nr:MAG: hypothetical protein COV74_03520 [Candidatus Omnitrophica bacterium CG11_big_fil_rev_8_21_14_0_20_45_26]PIW63351.1 MAG: hypothetical protein COW12_10715 [Candidatus Omnitrophica bacterium CG12_big_fil_rev_8_21_14_0_65_45_16]